MACETEQLLTRETPDFIVPTLWLANSPDLNPVDYRVEGKLQECMYHSRIHDVASAEVPYDPRARKFQQLIIDEAVGQWL